MRKVLAGLVVASLFAGVALAQLEKVEGGDVTKTVTGVVAVKTAEDGVKSVTVGAVAVVMDDNGKKLVDMAGKTVEVTGVVTEKGMVVKTMKEVVVAPAVTPKPVE